MRQQHSAIAWVMFTLVLGLCSRGAHGREPQPTRDLFQDLKPLVNELDRYTYLVWALPELSPVEREIAKQLLAATEAELGLYSEAVRDFPLSNNLPPRLTLPQKPAWQAADAVTTIVGLARDRRIVMVNEAHHDAHTRQLTLALLPRLRALGFGYFAVEALGEKDPSLSARGYPVRASGSEYLREPVYGEIIRAAIRLGFVLVPYDTTITAAQAREDKQADNLYRRVFARDPAARLFVHTGYAHIDKQRGRLGPVKPMAMRLQDLSGIEPLSIDQTDIREDHPKSEAEARIEFRHALLRYQIAFQPEQPKFGNEGPGDMPSKPAVAAYERIIATFHPSHPVALVRTDNGKPWSARPRTYDLNVILPVANSVPSDYMQGPIHLSLDDKVRLVLPPASRGHRPEWLALDGQRVTVAIDTRHCAGTFPCLVQAHYADEGDVAVAADRYLFLQPESENLLYLYPGKYRLRTVNANGITVDEHAIEAAK